MDPWGCELHRFIWTHAEILCITSLLPKIELLKSSCWHRRGEKLLNKSLALAQTHLKYIWWYVCKDPIRSERACPMGPGGAFLWWDSGHMNSLYWLMIGTESGHDTDASAHYNQDYEQPMTSLRQLLGGTGDSQNICMGSFDSWGQNCRWHRKDQLLVGHWRCECIVWAHEKQRWWHHKGHCFMQHGHMNGSFWLMVGSIAI